MEDLNDRLRKAAALVASLDESTANSLLSQLTPAEAAAVRAAAESLDKVDRLEQEALAREIESRRVAAQVTKSSQAVELELRSQPSPSADTEQSATYHVEGVPPHGAQQVAPRAFNFLQHANTAELCSYLEGEHIQVVALVVSALPPERAIEVLFSLPEERRREAMLRLAQGGQMDPTSVEVIETHLAEWMHQQQRGAAEKVAGRQWLTQVLTAAEPSQQQALLSSLRKGHPNLAQELAASVAPVIAAKASRAPSATATRPPHGSGLPSARHQGPPPATSRFSFADLQQWDTASLVALFRTANPQLTVLALAGADESMLRRITSRLPRRAARQLRRDVRQLGPTRLSDVETAQAEIAALAEHLRTAGPN